MASSSKQPMPVKSLPQVVREIGDYPLEGFEFVAAGVTYTVSKIHRSKKCKPDQRHVTGAQLCDGLRELAVQQWGYLARTVLRRWNIQSTADFGRIVFALVDNGFLQKTEQDRIEDFRDVFDFEQAFERGYQFELKS
jgi:uncharacterized repeat protein (TIGR04138 family)